MFMDKATEQIVERAEKIEQSGLSQFEKKVLSFAENQCKTRADLIQASAVLLRMIQEIDSAEQFNEMLPVLGIRPCTIQSTCTVIEFEDANPFHSGNIENVRPSELAIVPSLRIG